MDPENITPESLPQEGGDGAVDEVVTAPAEAPTAPEDTTGTEGFSLDELNAVLGKNFETKDAALKSIKDTQSFVGKKSEDVEKELKDKGYLSREDLENELFFRDNPDHADNKALLEALAAKEGTTLKAASESDAYKGIYEKAANYEKSESKKSVLNPSPRLKQAVERTANVQELQQAGNLEGAQSEAAKAVMEAFDIEV